MGALWKNVVAVYAALAVILGISALAGTMTVVSVVYIVSCGITYGLGVYCGYQDRIEEETDKWNR